MGKEIASQQRKLTKEFLETALNKAGNSKTALSRALGIRLATVCFWYRGSQPGEKNLIKLEKYLKGDLRAKEVNRQKNRKNCL